MGLQIEEQQQLIEKFIRANAKFQGNEDLFDDFRSEAYQKSYIIFNSPAMSIQRIESYIQKVVNTSIISVLKDLGRLKKTSAGYTSSKEVSLSEEKSFEPTVYENSYKEENLNSRPVVYTFEIEDPKIGVEEEVIRKDLLQRIADTVCIIHSENPKKDFVDLFQYRYIEGFTQSKISEILNISQAEVCKRLIELSKQIKSRIN